MRTFEKWDEFKNKRCVVFLEHILFDKQQYDCEALQVVNDEEKIGVVIKGHELFVDKQDIKRFSVYENSCIVSNGMMTITIVNKM